MTDWRAQVRDAVEDADRDRLSADAVRAMRQTVVAAARQERGEVPPFSWRRPLALAGTLLLLIGGGITAGRRMDVAPSGRPPVDATAPAPIRPDGTARRQLQFSTPGGTRIIWVFNSDLDLKAAIP